MRTRLLNRTASDEDSCIFHIPGGLRLELCSQEGADAFLRYNPTTGPFNWLTTHFGECKAIRSRNRRLNAGEKERLTMIGFMASSFSRYATQAVFAEVISDEELVFWVKYVKAELKKLTNDPAWQRTGILARHDAFTINPCVYMFQHEAAASLAMECGLFEVMAEFIQARKAPLLPCSDVAETVCLSASNALCSYTMREAPTGLSLTERDDFFDQEVRRVFNEWEICGWLKQFIRCSTIPQGGDAHNFPLGILKVYELLSKQCALLVQEKFKKGEPCGDVILAIINGRDGSKDKRPKVMQRLQDLAYLANAMQPPIDDIEIKKICRKCNKFDITEEFQSSLKKCSQCKRVYYCSRDCQVADWKAHKAQCIRPTKTHRKIGDACTHIVLNWAKSNYIAIMGRVVEVCNELNLMKSDVLLELDFLPDENGSAPALRGDFKVRESRGYFEGERPNEPDWFYKHEDENVYRNNVKTIIAGLQDHHSRLTENHLLCFVRNPGGLTSCYRMQIHSPDGGTQMFGEDAFQAFRSALFNEDYTQLANLTGERVAAEARRLFLGMPSEADIERVRAILNAIGGHLEE